MKKINRQQITARFVAVLLGAFYLMRRLFTKFSRLANRHRLLTSIFIVSFVLLSSVIYVRFTSAATYTMVPDGDSTITGWAVGASADTSCTGGTLCDTVDDGTTDNNNDYIQTSTAVDGETFIFNLTTTPNIASATQVQVTITQRVTVVGRSLNDDLTVSLLVGGTAQTATGSSVCIPTINTWTTCTVTFDGSWSQSQVDGMQARVVRQILGSGGSTASRADTIQISNVKSTLTYTSANTTEQSGYRWYENNADPTVNDTFTKTPNPATLPTGVANDLAWSADTNYVSIAHNTSPFISIYKRTADTLTKLPNPSVLPTGNSSDSEFSSSGDYLAVGHVGGSSFLSIYKRSGDTFTFLANPSPQPTDSVYGVTWSPDGVYLATTYSYPPYLTVYKRSGDTFTALALPSLSDGSHGGKASWSPDGTYLSFARKDTPFLTTLKRSGDTFTLLSNPGSLASLFGRSVAWSPDNNYLSLAAESSPYLFNYKRSGDTFTKLADPATLPTGLGKDTTWSSAGNYVVAMHDTSPFMSIYKRSNDTFTKLADPSTLPAGIGYGADFTSDDLYLGTAHAATPYMTVYKSGTTASISTPLAATNTAATSPASGTTYRLRMNLHIGTAELGASGGSYKLRYAPKGSGACSAVAGTSYSDVTDSSDIRYADNPNLTSGMSLTTSTDDPSHSGHTLVHQFYLETGTTTFTNSTAIPAGQDGVWDFALTTGSAAPGSYCFKITTSTGTDLNTYTQYPELTIPATSILGQKDYRFYQNQDSTIPGTPLASSNTSATLANDGENFRLRNTLGISMKFEQISNGISHSCGVTSEGKAYCWGDNSYGKLGNGNTGTDSNVPVPVSTSGVLAGKTILSVSTGGSSTCVIASDNQAYCWGRNNFGQLGNGAGGLNADSSTPVAVSTTGALSGKNITSLTVGTATTVCAIASDNQAYCWGGNSSGELGNGTGGNNAESYIPVAVSTSGILSGKSIWKVGVGSSHACAVTTEGYTYCWGGNTLGQLGDGGVSGGGSYVPVAVSTTGVLSGKTIQSVAMGNFHTCVVASDEQAYCWGSNNYGQLGNGNTGTNGTVPAAISTSGQLIGKTILSISAGQFQTCAVASDNQAYCWGDNAEGQLGNGNTGTDSNVPVVVSTAGVLSGKTILQISVGAAGACAIASDNQVYCWGSNSYGQLGNGNTGTDSNVAVTVAVEGLLTGKTIKQISAGGNHTCAIASDNQAYCWGDNSNGRLGNGNTGTDSNVPVAVSTSGVLSGKTVLSIVTGQRGACVIASDNQVYCWGSNAYGQLGNSTNGSLQNQADADSNIPVAVSRSGVLSGKTVLSITAGGSQNCAIASDNQAYCWGFNNQGQLGNNSGTDSNVPVAVSTAGVLSGKTVLSIAGGNSHTCAIASDNQAYCWGDNANGKLGNGNTGTDSDIPVAVSTSGVLTGKNTLSITAGNSHTCAIASDNQAYCWGYNYDGQLGNANNTSSNVPVAVSTAGVLNGKTVFKIDASSHSNCVIASDNLAYCWGENYNGELGTGDTNHSNVPVAVSTAGVLNGKTIISVSSENDHACVIASDNLAYCWGYNLDGPLGDGTNTISLVPVAVYNDDPAPSIPSNLLSARLQFAAKGTAGTCSAVTGYSDITTTSAIAYADNSSLTNAATITTHANDPKASTDTTIQTYHESNSPDIANPNTISSGKFAMWDYSLKDLSAPGDTTYCLRLVGSDGSRLLSYTYFPEFTTASSAPAGPTLEQQVRGGQSVINGIKSFFSW